MIIFNELKTFREGLIFGGAYNWNILALDGPINRGGGMGGGV